MIFPFVTPIKISDQFLGFETISVKCDSGACNREKVLKILSSYCDFQPHNTIGFDFEPDEDCKKLYICDNFSIITISKINPNIKAMYWGKGKSFQASFIMALKLNGDFHPFKCIHDAKNVLELILSRQDYWGQGPEENFENYNSMEDLIKGLN